MWTETRYEVIPAGYTPDDWHAVEPYIMARLKAELALIEFSGFREGVERAAPSSVVHTYKGEGLTACGLEVVGPCPDCGARE